MTNLLDVVKEQAAFGFTGKINLLLSTSGQFQGVVYQQEGLIVGANYAQLKGKKALFKMVFEDVERAERFKFIVEPEVITHDQCSMKLSFEEARQEIQSIYQSYLLSKKLRPASNLRLVVDPVIIVNPDEITPSEFDVLSILAEWCTVADVYKYSKMMEYEVTNALVSLRKKRAIKVFQN